MTEPPIRVKTEQGDKPLRLDPPTAAQVATKDAAQTTEQAPTKATGEPVWVTYKGDADRATYGLQEIPYVGQIEPVMAATAALRGKSLVEAHGGTLDVALCIQGSVDLAWAVQRCQGMADALRPLGVRVDILSGEFFAQPPNVPTSVISQWFVDNPGVDFVFTTATPVLTLALSLREAGTIPHGAVIGSVDLNAETLDAIRTGACAFAVDQQPYLQGYMAITLLDLDGQFAIRPGAPIQTGPFFVDSSNVDQITLLVQEGFR